MSVQRAFIRVLFRRWGSDLAETSVGVWEGVLGLGLGLLVWGWGVVRVCGGGGGGHKLLWDSKVWMGVV